MKRKNLLKTVFRILSLWSGIFLMVIISISQTFSQVNPASDVASYFSQGKHYIPPGGQINSRDSDYLIDDGSSENAVGLTIGGDVMWLVPFDVIAGAEYIVSISLTWGCAAIPGSGPPNGAPTRVILYEDPNDDGDPSDAVYLTESPTVVANVDLDIFTVVSITPTLVSGKFFVAALYQNQPTGVFPASLDQTTSAGVAWLVGEDTPGAFDVYTLTNNDHIPWISHPGNWLLRAHGVSSPPGVPLATVWVVVALVAIGGTAFFKFRRRKN